MINLLLRHQIKMNNRGQLKISFGMIFSIILVIVFLAFGFFAIQKFIGIQDDLKMRKFTEDFQGDINNLLKSEQGSKTVEYSVLKEVESVCFVRNRGDRFETQITKDGIMSELNIDGIDYQNTIRDRKSICAKPSDGKIKFLLEKEYGEPLVTVKV